MKKILLLSFIFLFLAFARAVFAHQPQIVYYSQGNVQINNPETSQAFYDELKGGPRDYFINSPKDFDLYINLLVPAVANPNGRFSAKVYSEDGAEQLTATVDGLTFNWQEYYEPFGRDYYYKGPEFEKQVPAGKYKIEVYANGDLGKYVLAVGKNEVYDIKSLLNVYWELPLLKITFFQTSVFQFFLTPFGIGLIAVIGAIIILVVLLNFLVDTVKTIIRHNMAKTLLLTSAGLQMKDEIIALLQKPAYDITVAFINTATKAVEDVSFANKDLQMMNEMGFNVEEIDIEGKTSDQLLKIFMLKDIIFVEGGNAFYLLNAMRKCKFEKVIRTVLKEGKVYIGAGEGSVVAGRVGLNLVPFDILPHYTPELDQIIKQKIKNPKKRLKKLRILTDDQAILVQGKEISLIGKGEKIIV